MSLVVIRSGGNGVKDEHKLFVSGRFREDGKAITKLIVLDKGKETGITKPRLKNP
jgi:hypothetical protein